jgi:hypothetical protein
MEFNAEKQTSSLFRIGNYSSIATGGEHTERRVDEAIGNRGMDTELRLKISSNWELISVEVFLFEICSFEETCDFVSKEKRTMLPSMCPDTKSRLFGLNGIIYYY